jgi:hypothetical protein
MQRRHFLQGLAGILAAGVAPAIIAEPMKIWVPKEPKIDLPTLTVDELDDYKGRLFHLEIIKPEFKSTIRDDDTFGIQTFTVSPNFVVPVGPAIVLTRMASFSDRWELTSADEYTKKILREMEKTNPPGVSKESAITIPLGSTLTLKCPITCYSGSLSYNWPEGYAEAEPAKSTRRKQKKALPSRPQNRKQWWA